MSFWRPRFLGVGVCHARLYSKGTKKLTVSFAERNDSLSRLPRAELYPLLRNRRSDLEPTRIKNIVASYGHLEHTAVPETPEYEIRGRVHALRVASRGLMFLDVQEGGSKLQVVMNAKKLGAELDADETHMHSLIRRGDSISAVGRPWRTKAGELSLLSSMSIRLLSPSLHPLPDESASKTVRKHNRVAELKAFVEAQDVLRVRSATVAHIAEFLREKDFLQVHTPHLSSQRGGANARTFETRMEDGTPLYLRVAPELWLKRLIIAGFDRVFEVGNSYRNEGIDSTHNPEFTTCEFYMSFATLDDLVALTKELLVYVATRISDEFPQYADHCTVLREQQEWKTIDFLPELERLTGQPVELEIGYLRGLCAAAGLPCAANDDVAKLLDTLAGHYIEPQCEGPTFIVNHPSVMAPLAKEETRRNIAISRRFEFFIARREYVNAYEEENDPVSQLAKLRAQNPDVPDKTFVEALEWGLPPTGGWGLGVDRLVMLLTGSERIGDTLAFGDITQVNRL